MLKKPLIKFKTRRNLKQRKHQPAIDFKSSWKIAIIHSDLFENEQNIENLKRELILEGKEISTLVFCHNSKKINTSQPHFTKTDISTSGEIKGDDLTKFLADEYDFALCLDDSHHFLIDYVFSLLSAKCRIGIMQPSRNNLFEMMIHAENTESALSIEVLKYLKMIQNV